MAAGVGNMIIQMIRPKAKQYLNQENLNKVFETVMARYPVKEEERGMLLISRRVSDGMVVASAVGVGKDNRIVEIYDQQPLDKVVLDLLEQL